MLSKLIFVYGTLKSGYGNNRLITRCSKSTLLDVGITQETMFFSNGGIPFMLRDLHEERAKSTGDGSNSFMVIEDYLAPVVGEVWTIRSEEVITNMDRLEGHPHGYRREPLTVYQLGNENEVYECEGYFYQHNMKLTQPNHQIGEKYYHSWPTREYAR